jgi:methylated-DNA-[protein]-cysteine S-methyltransferase
MLIFCRLGQNITVGGAGIEPAGRKSVTAFSLFETPVGTCGIAWSGGGLIGLQLPEGEASATEARLLRRFPDAVREEPTAEVAGAIAAIQALLAGEPTDLFFIRLDDMAVGEFDRSVYALVRAIPPGETLTYGEIAKRLGDPHASRAVGRSLGTNPWPIVVPCHRVLGADGRIGGFSAHGGVETKIRMLQIEKARTDDRPALFEELPLAIKPRR